MSTFSGLTLKGYDNVSPVYESSKTLVYRAIRAEDSQAVVIKMLRRDYPTSGDIAGYQQEYDILCNLTQETVINAYGLERYQNTVFLVLEDFGGDSLQKLIVQPVAIAKVLDIAIALTTGLQNLHQANIIHQDINPANVVFNPETEKLKIIDFGISTALPEAVIQTERPEKLQGTLAYLSPEQTGRMNRPVDYRTDFYGLGATLYALLLGQPPFTHKDATALVHAHLAQKPIPPHEVDPNIPQGLSDIVLKLLAKNAEDRYQSASGLLTDFTHCQQQFAESGQVDKFILGEQDQSPRLQLSKRIYGREQETQVLVSSFDRLMQSAAVPQVILVSGAAGTGKTALLQELYKPLSAYSGYFISGKYEQLQRGTPYSAIFQAFNALIEQLLTLPANELYQWRSQLKSALADNLSVMVEALPELALIVGEQALPPHLEPKEARNRFQFSVVQFVQVFTQGDQPLVMLLDDLHWADDESLDLLSFLIDPNSAHRLLLVGTYRSEEISATHSLTQTIEALESSDIHVSSVQLSALPTEAVQHFLQDTLRRTVADVSELAQLIVTKTAGNPFFIGEFLKSLVTTNLLWFDTQKSGWNWDVSRIQQSSITVNLIELLTQRLRRLQAPTQTALQLAACLGSQFSLETLAVVSQATSSEESEQSESEQPESAQSKQLTLAQRLHEAILAGILLPLNSDYRGQPNSQTPLAELTYRFVHDRVQQAAYMLMPEAERYHAHWLIGKQLWQQSQKIPQAESQSLLFGIINQLNLGLNAVGKLAEPSELAPSESNLSESNLSESDRSLLVSLNLQAGQQSNQSAAFATATTYLKQAIALTRPQDWAQNNTQMLTLYREMAEATYANSQYDALNGLAAEIFEHTKDVLETVWLYELLVQAKLGQNQLTEAISLGLSVLQRLGITLPNPPALTDIESAAGEVQIALTDKDMAALVDLPKMEDPKIIAAMKILTRIFTPAYFSNPMLVPLITFKQVELSLTYGNAPLSSLAYVYYGLLLCSQFGQIEIGYAFGQLGLSLMEQQCSSKSVQATTMMTAVGFVTHFKEPISDNLAKLLRAYQLGLDSGDLEISAHSASMYALQAYLVGMPLPQLEQRLASYCKSLQQFRQGADLDFVRIYRQGILNLMGDSPERDRLSGEVYDESIRIPEHLQTSNRSALFLAYSEKSLLCYLFANFTEALTFTERAKEYVDAVTGSMNTAVFYVLDSLIRLANCEPSPQEETVQEEAAQKQETLLATVEQNQQILEAWAQHCPHNHLTGFTMVAAEHQRVMGHDLAAIDSYEKAIRLAQETGVLQDEALANELAGRFHLAQQRNSIADTYLLNARYAYQQWGAIAKVQDLDNRYPQLAIKLRPRKAKRTGTASTTTLDNNSTTEEDTQSLDVTALMKSTQALAVEIASEKLLKTLMRIVLENAGAQRGVLMLPREDDWWVEAEGTTTAITMEAYPLQAPDEQAPDEQAPDEQASGNPTSDEQTSGNPTSDEQTLAHNSAPSVVPLSVVNYVMRRQLIVALSHALNDEQFAQDEYIQHYQTQSLLCLPLLNQGQLNGILYLENNLAQGVFEQDRVETLKILLAQAAVSIQNAHLYDQLEAYNKTLEQQVSARTQELSQTLDVLKATQAELVVENALLRSDTAAETYSYQVGGSLPMDSPTYVVRRADRQLYQALRQGQYCYVLNARQMGKSSLRIQMMRRLQADGVACSTIDLSVIGNHKTTLEQWYVGFAYALTRSLKLSQKVKFRQWWKDHSFLSPIQRLDLFIEEIVLTHIETEIVLFIDEIDSTLSLDFAADDFFIWLRACFNKRSEASGYRRLAIVLIGVATPSQLIDSTKHTPFNIGQYIKLNGFALHEAQPLLYGFTEYVQNPQAVLAHMLSWTGGQPFLSQKICQIIRQRETPIAEGQEQQTVDELVRSQILKHWEIQDDPEHLRTIRDRLCSRGELTLPMLQTYQQILQGEAVLHSSQIVHQELILSGLVIQREGQLAVANRIYETVFDLDWVQKNISHCI